MAEFKFVKYVALNCDNCNCGKLFFRRGNEYRKEEAAGVKHRYCSKKCSWSRHQDGLPAFRFYVRKAKWSCQYRKRSILKFRKEGVRMEMSLTAEYLKRVWDSQGGTCPYTGFKLTLLQDKKGEKRKC